MSQRVLIPNARHGPGLEGEMELRPFSNLTLGEQTASVTKHDPLHRGQADTCPWKLAIGM